MLFEQDVFLGIDPGGGRSPMVWAAINPEGKLLALRDGSLEDVVTFARSIAKVVVAINSPASISRQLLLDPAVRDTLQPPPKAGRFSSYRVCEYLLKCRNIRLIPTPAKSEQAPDWMRKGFLLFRQLQNIETIPVYETNSHAAFCGLLGRIPFLKQSSEGRIQRQLILNQCGLHLMDPMDYYEEITRRKLLQGILPDEKLYSGRELDALVSALTAWRIKTSPEEVLAIGDLREGQIYLPVASLKDRYH